MRLIYQIKYPLYRKAHYFPAPDYKILSASAEKMGGEAMKRKPGKRSRSIIGISLTLGVFAFIVLALNFWLGWPTSLLTLGGMLGIAWFVSMFAGEQLTPPGLGTTLRAAWPWRWPSASSGLGCPGGWGRRTGKN
ncbi:MAG: hypothetical protein CEE41_02645 [Hadesarchaea archaeon B3_Hades]|nr:MAG: hypothetical protein CEE41_02645 [Hadesarchaea archaeon B3_Hades]